MLVELAQAWEQSGVVDYHWTYDLLAGAIPRSLWVPEVTPAATVMKDCDSFYDPYVLLGLLAGAAPTLGLALTGTNATRMPPAEFMRAMMTLASATEAKTIFSIGTGEAYNLLPYGYKRPGGLARLEDHFRLYQLLWECEEPFDFEGKTWKFTNAYIGTARPAKKPECWAMGGGPKLFDLAAKYADGLMSWVPNAFSQPEHYAAMVNKVRENVERNGRDPDQFRFGIQFPMLLHEDEAALERGLNNPLAKIIAAAWGRTSQKMWATEGIKSVYPEDWLYTDSFLPNDITREEAEAVVSEVPREMVAAAFTCGTPKEAAAVVQDYIDAGASFVGPADLLPLAFGPEEAEASMNRQLEVCRIIKEAN